MVVFAQKIFVFGSNMAGRHGKGAALTAFKKHGAIYGQGYGLQGNSFGIPTKDGDLRPLSLARIEKNVDTFIKYASLNETIQFIVTRIGCGEAGYDDSEIAPLFKNAPENCILPVGWRAIAEANTRNVPRF